MNLYEEGDSRLDLLNKAKESLCAREELEDDKQQELIKNLRSVEEEWRRLLDFTQQLKVQTEQQNSLLRELEAHQEQERSMRSWVEEQMQNLLDLDKDIPHQELREKVQVSLDGQSMFSFRSHLNILLNQNSLPT